MGWDPYHPVRVVRMSYLDSGRGPHTHKSYFSPWPRLPRASPTIEFSPGRRGGPFCQGHGEGFLSPDRSWPRIMEPGSPSKPGSTSAASAEERFSLPRTLDRTVEFGTRPPLLTMFRRRAGCEPNSHHSLLLFDLATAILWRSMPCKSAVLKPDMHNGRATAGGGREAGGKFIDLFNPPKTHRGASQTHRSTRAPRPSPPACCYCNADPHDGVLCSKPQANRAWKLKARLRIEHGRGRQAGNQTIRGPNHRVQRARQPIVP